MIAASATGEFIFGTESVVLDKIILTTIVSATVGFAFAWYIPQAAAAAQCDPLTTASEERIDVLKTAARERLGDAAAAIWLNKMYPILGDKSPCGAAAASVDGFENAIALLQGPCALAA
jgi:hypothetical protein